MDPPVYKADVPLFAFWIPESGMFCTEYDNHDRKTFGRVRQSCGEPAALSPIHTREHWKQCYEVWPSGYVCRWDPLDTYTRANPPPRFDHDSPASNSAPAVHIGMVLNPVGQDPVPAEHLPEGLVVEFRNRNTGKNVFSEGWTYHWDSKGRFGAGFYRKNGGWNGTLQKGGSAVVVVGLPSQPVIPKQSSTTLYIGQNLRDVKDRASIPDGLEFKMIHPSGREYNPRLIWNSKGPHGRGGYIPGFIPHKGQDWTEAANIDWTYPITKLPDGYPSVQTPESSTPASDSKVKVPMRTISLAIASVVRTVPSTYKEYGDTLTHEQTTVVSRTDIIEWPPVDKATGKTLTEQAYARREIAAAAGNADKPLPIEELSVIVYRLPNPVALGLGS